MKLLFVENEQTFLKYLTNRMVSEGFTVKATFSGEEAILAAAEEKFDVAIVELQLPGIDGIEVLKTPRTAAALFAKYRTHGTRQC